MMVVFSINMTSCKQDDFGLCEPDSDCRDHLSAKFNGLRYMDCGGGWPYSSLSADYFPASNGRLNISANFSCQSGSSNDFFLEITVFSDTIEGVHEIGDANFGNHAEVTSSAGFNFKTSSDYFGTATIVKDLEDENIFYGTFEFVVHDEQNDSTIVITDGVFHDISFITH